MKRGRTGRRAAGLVVLTAVIAGVGAGVAIHALSSGGGSSGQDNPPGLHGQATWNPGERPAPGFRLADQSGRPVSMASLRGRSVVLVFFSSLCRLACAREARTLQIALRLVPPSARPALVIVSLDPAHDTPESTRAAVARWGLASATEWHWLIGRRDELRPVWRAYGVGAWHTDGSTAGKTRVYVIDRKGFERAGLLYPFPPGWPAGDLRVVARDG